MTDVETIALVEQLLQRGRLTTVQEIVFSESWAGQTYLDMAVNSGYDPGYIKDVGSELWRSISRAVEEKVTKTNLHGVLHRAAQLQPDKTAALTLNSPPVTNYTNWGEAIPHSGGYANDVTQFYGRIAELTTLNRWISGEHCRVVAILGIGGIGKTALSVKLAEQLEGEFEYVIWRSIRNTPALPDLLANIVAVLSRQQEIQIALTNHISRLIYYLQQHRCLLVLDNVESILLGKRPCQYLAGYESYGELFRQLAECSHQSCVVLTSREQIAEVSMFAGAHLPIRILPLRGLSIARSPDCKDLRLCSVESDRRGLNR
jgi:NB-ARC domain